MARPVSDREENGYAVPPKVSGAINEHTHSYWRLALPALGVRYIGQYFDPLIQKVTQKQYHHYFDAAAGAWMFGVTSLFAYSTLRDMKNVFAEAIAYETGKKPEDVGYLDLFKSSNKSIVKARRNMISYNALRGLANLSFFGSHFSRFVPGEKWKKAVRELPSTNLGVGVNSAYLFGEVVFRDRTFFEQLQNFVDTKLNQQNALGEDIQPIDLLRLYERNALDNDPENAFKGKVSHEMWKDSQVIFQRMTDLMNHTYQDKKAGRQADFTLPKFLYMLGHNLIDPRRVEQTLAYIEVANAYGAEALKQVVKKVQKGDRLAAALKEYPVTIPTWKDETPPQDIVEFAPKGRKIVNGNGKTHLPEGREDSFVKRYADKPQFPAAAGMGLPE